MNTYRSHRYRYLYITTIVERLAHWYPIVLIVVVLKSWYQTSPLLIGGTRTPDLGGTQGSLWGTPGMDPRNPTFTQGDVVQVPRYLGRSAGGGGSGPPRANSQGGVGPGDHPQIRSER